MQKILFLLVLLPILFSSWIFAQNETVKLFQLNKVQMTIKEYPWANELSLEISGSVNPVLKGCFLTITVFFFDKEILQFRTDVKEKTSEQGSTSYAIDLSEEPINGATEDVLIGEYQVKIAFNLASQERRLRRLLSREFRNKEAETFTRNFFIGNKKEFEQQTKELKDFYIERMKNLNDSFALLQEKLAVARNARKDSALGKINEFSDGQQFDPSQWRNWFDQNYLLQVNREKSLLERHQQRTFALRFPLAHNSMSEYCNILIRMGRLASMEIHNYFKIQQDRGNLRQLDLYAISNKRDLIRRIQELHSSAAREMQISLRATLGYLPPPVK